MKACVSSQTADQLVSLTANSLSSNLVLASCLPYSTKTQLLTRSNVIIPTQLPCPPQLRQAQSNYHNPSYPSSPSTLPSTRSLTSGLRTIASEPKPIMLQIRIGRQTIPEAVPVDYRTVLEASIVRLNGAGAAGCEVGERRALRVADAAEDAGVGVECGWDVVGVEHVGCAVGCGEGQG